MYCYVLRCGLGEAGYEYVRASVVGSFLRQGEGGVHE